MMNNKPVPPTMPMVIRLEAQQWNVVLGALGKAPYEIVAPLIQAVQEQLQLQAEEASTGAGLPLGNGLDAAPGERTL